MKAAAFTLLEILLVCAVIAVLAAIAIPASSRMSAYSARMKSISNMRQIGVAARLYANDHNQQIPGQPSAGPLGGTGSEDQWPALLVTYLTPSDPVVFLDPSDLAAAKLLPQEILSNSKNNTGFIYNGFDEYAVDQVPPRSVSLTNLANMVNVVLLAQKTKGADAFYLSALLQPVGDLLNLLNPVAYDGGSHYLFVDGSVRYIKATEYSNSLWLVDKSLPIPLPPLPPLIPRGAGPPRIVASVPLL